MTYLNLVKSLSIAERSQTLFPYYQSQNFSVGDHLSKWIRRKSLCTQQDIEASIRISKISKQEFNCGIKPLTKRDKEYLWDTLKTKNWFLLNQKIFSRVDPELCREPKTFSYILRFHLDYAKTCLEKLRLQSNNMAESSFDQILQLIEDDLLAIGLRTFIVDLHEQKAKMAFVGTTSTERFRFYLKKRFSEKSIGQFFAEYPVLWRLFAERIQFHLNNLVFFMDKLEVCLDKLSVLFNLSIPYKVLIHSLDNSDSHDQGKTVIIFQVNEQKLVFKFKNLMIGEKWNAFLSIIEQKTGSQFYKVKRITAKDYAIEEFVEFKESMNSEELAEFYYRFGEYTAICYFLCGTDFHAENIIAYRDFPVLIDIETLLQNDNLPQLERNAYVNAIIKKSYSVLSTSLLPIASNEIRVAPEVSGRIGKSMNQSGLSGGRQLLFYKTLQIVEENTDNIHLEYKERYTEEQRNIPKVNTQSADPFDYTDQIVEGFTAQYQFFLENQEFLVAKINELFTNTQFRCLLKSTQHYYDMIDYGKHFSCMKDYLEREKLFENQWAYSRSKRMATCFEVTELLQNDIPIFFSNSSSKDLISSTGVKIKDYYNETALKRVNTRIKALSKTDQMYQLMLLKNSLKYNCEKQYYSLGKKGNQQLQTIVQLLRRRAVFDSEYDQVLFIDFTFEAGIQDVSVTDSSFYEGLAGIYVFLLYYLNFYPDKEIKKIVTVLKKQLFEEQTTKLANTSVYFGKLSILVALYYTYALFGKKEILERALKLVEEILDKLNKTIIKADWLTGLSGTIKLLISFYKLTKKSKFLMAAERLMQEIDLSTIHLNGLSHGYSGVLIALSGLQRYSKNDYQKLINKCLEQERINFNGKFWSDLRKGLNFTAQWCHGCAGIGLARLELLKLGFSDTQILNELELCVDHILETVLDDDCLCHGNAGNTIFLEEVYKSNYLCENKNHQISKKLIAFENSLSKQGTILEGMEAYPRLGLMNGITGVGFYRLYQQHKSKIPNILILE